MKIISLGVRNIIVKHQSYGEVFAKINAEVCSHAHEENHYAYKHKHEHCAYARGNDVQFQITARFVFLAHDFLLYDSFSNTYITELLFSLLHDAFDKALNPCHNPRTNGNDAPLFFSDSMEM